MTTATTRTWRLAAFAVSLMMSPSASADNWPQWRGPAGTGASNETRLPETWNDTQNIAWKARLAGVGVSSPIVWGDRVFVTSQVGQSASRQGPRLGQGGNASSAEKSLTRAAGQRRGVSFLVEALNRGNGERAWTFELPSEGDLPFVHDKHNLASASPVTDGERVYAVFGSGQVVAVDMSGKQAWTRNLAEEVPAPRGEELIVNSSTGIEAYDLATGRALWHFNEPNQFPIPVAMHHQGIIYLSRGYRSGPYAAIRPGGRGDISRTHVVWHVSTGAPYVSSIVYYDGLLYMAGDVGVITCVDAQTGAAVWRERLGGVYTASPVAADGKIFLLSESGETIVLRAGRTPQVIARNQIDGRVLASPAISGGRIFIRTDDQVIAVGP